MEVIRLDRHYDSQTIEDAVIYASGYMGRNYVVSEVKEVALIGDVPRKEKGRRLDLKGIFFTDMVVSIIPNGETGIDHFIVERAGILPDHVFEEYMELIKGRLAELK